MRKIEVCRRHRVAVRSIRAGVCARALGLVAIAGSILFSGLAGAPLAAQNVPNDLSSASLEQLMQIEVTSASKKSETLSKAPAAIYVITGEAIQRGGFSSIPDALRMVPGLYVAQTNAHVWVVSARGFANSFNDKMLVLIDGRVVFSPTFGGVYWDVQDPPLEDIDRIEVIRGPGGTLWGANAVNGVINIITKNASQTQGPQVVASAGINEGYASRVRYGGSAGSSFSYRLYGTGNYWLPSGGAAGGDSFDAWTISQGGVRFDWKLNGKDTFTFDGEGYSGRVRDVTLVFSPVSEPSLTNIVTVVKGGHVLGRWKHEFSERSSTDVVAYCDWSGRVAILFTDIRDTCDFEAQYNIAISPRHSVISGGEINTTGDTWPSTFTASMTPPYSRLNTFSGFVQYDFALIPDTLRIIAGTKLEHNDYTGFEYQPQIRAVWTPNSSNTVWAAVSRAVRTPQRIDEDLLLRLAQTNPDPPPLTFLLIQGSHDERSEILHAYELGYRYEWAPKFSADAAIYYNQYDRLTGTVLGAPIINPSPPYIDLPEVVESLDRGQTHGLELALGYAPLQRWNLAASVTLLRGTSTPTTGFPAVEENPLQQYAVQSRLNVTRSLSFDSVWYHYDGVEGDVAGLNRADAGLSTSPWHGFSSSVWGRNLQQDHHHEGIATNSLPGEIRRSLVFKIVWEPHDPATPSH